MAVGAELVGVERLRQAAADVVAERHRAQQRRAVAPLALGHGKRRRNNAAARMRLRRRMRVIGLVGVGEHAVRQRGIGGSGDDRAADHAGLADATERLYIRDRLLSRRKARSGDHRRNRVEQVMLGLLRHRRRQRLAQRRRDVSAQLPHHRRDLCERIFAHDMTPARSRVSAIPARS